MWVRRPREGNPASYGAALQAAGDGSGSSRRKIDGFCRFEFWVSGLRTVRRVTRGDQEEGGSKVG